MSLWIVFVINALIIFFVTIFFFWNVYATIFGAPFVPSSKKRIQAMKQLANFRDSDTFLDVGSGDGRVLRAVATHVRVARGIEINSTLVWWSIMMNRIHGLENVHIIKQDFWKKSIADVDVMFAYCIDSKMNRLEEKIKNEMKPGSRIISNGFILPSLQPHKQVDGVTLYVL